MDRALVQHQRGQQHGMLGGTEIAVEVYYPLPRH